MNHNATQKKKKSTTNEPQNVKSHDKNLKQNSNFGGKNPYDWLDLIRCIR